MPRKGENIYKRKDGRWEGRYIRSRTEDGKAIYGYVYAKSYRAVKDRLKQSLSSSLEEVLSAGQKTADSAVFETICERWFTATRPHIKESTAVKYRNLLNNYIFPELGSLTLSQLSQIRIENFCSKMLCCGSAKGTGLSSKTVSDLLVLLRSILHFASENGSSLPCDGHNIQIKSTCRKMRVLSKGEQMRLCRELYRDPCAPNVGILVCLFTGIRIGEICALRWEDISLTEQTIHIQRTMQRIQNYETTGAKTKIIVTAPKSVCSIRTIPLPDELGTIISAFCNFSCGYFLTGSEDKYIEPRTMQNHFKRVLKRCNIEDANYHALRHTFATRCVEVGFDVKTLSEILGHANVSITMNRYVHPTMELKRENMQRLSSLITVR